MTSPRTRGFRRDGKPGAGVARWLRATLCLLALLGGAGSRAAPQAAPAAVPTAPVQHILLLYAYGYGGRGVELFNEGFFRAITEAGVPVSNVYAEYLDLQRNRNVPGYRKELLDLLRNKYESRHIELIVTVQQPALDFLLTDGKDIAPLAPVIAIQHRPLLDAERTTRRIVGEVNNFDIRGTLERALELFPQTRRVLFASGSSEADIKLSEEIARVVEPWAGKLEFEYTTGKTLDQILQRAASLPPQSIIVFTQYNRDAQGRVALAYEAEHMIVKAANAPVFGFYDYNLRNGGIGGAVIGVEASGIRSGRLAVDILNGAKPPQFGTLRVSESVPMFSWPQIERWGGDSRRLPAHTVFVDRPPSLWQLHGGPIVGIVLLVLTQTALIAVLLINVRRRQRAESVLGESEANFHAMFDAMPDAAVFADPDRRIRMVNPAFTQMFGYLPDEVIGRTTEFAYADPADYVDQGRRRFNREAGGERGAYEMRYRRKGGEEFWAETSGAQILGPDGKVLGLMGMMRDVTERRRAEGALRSLASDLGATLRAIPDLLFELDAAGRYVKVNAAHPNLLAMPEAQLVGRTVNEVLPAEAARAVLDALAAAAETGSDYGRMIALPLMGATRWFELSVARKEGSAGGGEAGEGMLHFIMLARDVTARRNAERDLVRQAAELARHNEELERFNRATVGRELDMIALKQQINELSRQLGRDPPFALAFLDAPEPPPQEGGKR